ncbi:MAG: SRPBCC family protein [Solirubrobacterales bacterium]
MASVQESIEVDVPARTAYNQWTQFEEFPRFMEGVEEVRQLDDTHIRWRADIWGKKKEWTAEITEQRPDERVAWKNVDGAENAGVISFHRVGEGRARITAQIEAEPEGMVEATGDLIGVLDRRVKGDLRRFKEFIEASGGETGAWRGEVDQDPTS